MSREKREALIDTMSAAILVDRAATHGSPEDNFSVIAQFWNVYLHKKYNIGYLVTYTDVAMMMALLKVARATSNPGHVDNYVDGAGYMLLAGEHNV